MLSFNKMKTKHKGIIIPDYFIALQWIKKGGKCMSDLHKDLNITYKHLHELKHTFIDLEWIIIRKEKRRHVMYLTQKGNDIEIIIDKFLQSMNIHEDEILKYIDEGKLKKKEKIDIEKLKKEIFEYDD
jgi:predicted transcriptional regulator